MAEEITSYNLGAIRKLLLAAFTAEELHRFCLDRPTFQDVADRLGPKFGLADMVDELMEFCRTRLLWEELLSEVQKANPRQYRRYERSIHGMTYFAQSFDYVRRYPWRSVLLMLCLLVVGFVVGYVIKEALPGMTPTSEPPDISLASLSYQIDGDVPRVIDLRSAENPGIAASPGNRLKLTDLWYAASQDGTADTSINGEIYVGEQIIGWTKDVSIERGIHHIGDFIPSNFASGDDPQAWQVQEGWPKLTIVLILYRAGRVIERQHVRIALSEDGSPGLMPLKPSVSLATLGYAINDGPTRFLDLRNYDNAGIAALPGDKLELREIWYRADRSGTSQSQIDVEMYLTKEDGVEYDSGYITEPIMPRGGRHPISTFSGYGWEISEDVTGISVRLIQYSEVVDWFDIPLTALGGSELVPLVEFESAAPLPPQPVNVHQEFEFEESIDDWQLQTCIAADCIWTPATENLYWSEDSYTGNHSLGVTTVSSDTEKFYSIQLCWETGILVRGAGARVYVPARTEDPGVPSAFGLNLLLGPSDLELRSLEWPISMYNVAKPGWHYILLDLRQVLDDDGKPYSEYPAQCVHIDLALSAVSSQQSEIARFFVDDVELFTALSTQP